MTEKDLSAVSGPEQECVARALLNWLNQYPYFPERAAKIEMEFLGKSAGMGLFASASAYKTREFISGAYEAQYQFALQFRTAPANSAQRLKAAETLSRIAEWAEKREDLPDLGAGKYAVSVARSSPAVLTARYEDGSEDYQILMSLNYNVRAGKF